MVIDKVSPDARDNGRREPAPVVVSETIPASETFDWLDAGVGAGRARACCSPPTAPRLLARSRRHTAGV